MRTPENVITGRFPEKIVKQASNDAFWHPYNVVAGIYPNYSAALNHGNCYDCARKSQGYVLKREVRIYEHMNGRAVAVEDPHTYRVDRFTWRFRAKFPRTHHFSALSHQDGPWTS